MSDEGIYRQKRDILNFRRTKEKLEKSVINYICVFPGTLVATKNKSKENILFNQFKSPGEYRNFLRQILEMIFRNASKFHNSSNTNNILLQIFNQWGHQLVTTSFKFIWF